MNQDRKKLWIGALLVAIGLIMYGVYNLFRAQPVSGAKNVTVEVLPAEEEMKTYSVSTDAEYLSGVMDELKGTSDFTYEASDSGYGLFVNSVNGVTADYSTTGTYWAIYVNGEYGQYGIDQQPVNDGDVFRLAVESAS